jgi:hypothetical protein
MHDDFEARRTARRRFMRRNVIWLAPLGLAAAVGFFFGIGYLVEWLWRVTLVDLFAIRPISFWQAWGIILLSQILFKANVRRSVRTGRWRRHEAYACGPRTAPEPPSAGTEV